MARSKRAQANWRRVNSLLLHTKGLCTRCKARVSDGRWRCAKCRDLINAQARQVRAEARAYRESLAFVPVCGGREV